MKSIMDIFYFCEKRMYIYKGRSKPVQLFIQHPIFMMLDETLDRFAQLQNY